MSTQPLPITSIPLGGQAQLVAQLTENGAAYVPPAGAPPFTFSPSVSSSDPNVSSAPATADVTNGAVPLNQQFLLTDAASDTVAAVDAVTVSGHSARRLDGNRNHQHHGRSKHGTGQRIRPFLAAVPSSCCCSSGRGAQEVTNPFLAGRSTSRPALFRDQ